MYYEKIYCFKIPKDTYSSLCATSKETVYNNKNMITKIFEILGIVTFIFIDYCLIIQIIGNNKAEKQRFGIDYWTLKGNIIISGF